MTSSRYLVARFAQAFGYFRRAQRMADAASEMHLLREAEAYLGASIWEKVEGIDALSVEYWNLRKLIKERDDVRNRLAACQERLDRAHEERSNLLNNMPEENQDLLDERTALLTKLENLAHKRDQIVADAREVRRAYVGLNMKLEVIAKESSGSAVNKEQIAEVKSRLAELKSRFAELKQERIKIGEAIEEGDAKVDLVDEKLREKRQERRIQASEAFQVIGDGNKEISILRAESGVIDTRMRQLYAEIGRYVSRNANQNPSCAAAAAAHHGLVDVMRAMRRSVALNHRLAGNA
jgi:DNA repair exonuclease SbcCD ATPase subunit